MGSRVSQRFISISVGYLLCSKSKHFVCRKAQRTISLALVRHLRMLSKFKQRHSRQEASQQRQPAGDIDEDSGASASGSVLGSKRRRVLVAMGDGAMGDECLRRYVDEFVTPIAQAVEREQEQDVGGHGAGRSPSGPDGRAFSVAFGAWEPRADIIALNEPQLCKLLDTLPERHLAR